VHLSRIGDGLSPLNRCAVYLERAGHLLQSSASGVGRNRPATRLDDLRQQAAAAHTLTCSFCARLSAAARGLIFFMKRRWQKGEKLVRNRRTSAGVRVQLFDTVFFSRRKTNERRCKMETANSLIERIDAEFSATEQRWDQLRVKQLEVYQVRQQRLECFERIVETLRELWEPRLDALSKRFGKNMDVLPIQERGRRAVSLEFGSNLARILLRFAVSPDADARKLVVSLRC
jgi:hypothetical protein